MNIKTILEHYLICALWSSVDTNDIPLDNNYSIDDIEQESIDQAEKDIISFVETSKNLLDTLNEEQIGHDFWLTRNGHGCGFFDRGYHKNVSDYLTKQCDEFGECYLYVGDDGKIYME